MTPGARIAATIEILEKIERSFSPADEVISAYLRGRRYIGSRDRRDISGRVFDTIRRRARLNWWTKDGNPRLQTIANLVLGDGVSVDHITALFNGEGYGPDKLSESELELAKNFVGRSLDSAEMPAWVRHETPEFLCDEIAAGWGDSLGDEAAALNRPAPLDLRVNTLKADCRRALEILGNDGIEAEATPHSPIGLRIGTRVNLRGSTAFKGGFVEIQDEGSQLVALLLGAIPGMQVIDFCAGGGGKTLAVAAAMKNKSGLTACDIDRSRMDRMTSRLKRAGVNSLKRHTLDSLEDNWIAENRGVADRVLLDVPCTGSGAWRRNPDAKWRLTPEKLDDFLAQQRAILDAAAPLVKPGGRLIYATCSILDRENMDQVDAFLSTHPEFSLSPVAKVWAETIGGDAPDGCEATLNLTPYRHNTDGFFAAVLEKDDG